MCNLRDSSVFRFWGGGWLSAQCRWQSHNWYGLAISFACRIEEGCCLLLYKLFLPAFAPAWRGGGKRQHPVYINKTDYRGKRRTRQRSSSKQSFERTAVVEVSWSQLSYFTASTVFLSKFWMTTFTLSPPLPLQEYLALLTKKIQ